MRNRPHFSALSTPRIISCFTRVIINVSFVWQCHSPPAFSSGGAHGGPLTGRRWDGDPAAACRSLLRAPRWPGPRGSRKTRPRFWLPKVPVFPPMSSSAPQRRRHRKSPISSNLCLVGVYTFTWFRWRNTTSYWGCVLFCIILAEIPFFLV